MRVSPHFSSLTVTALLLASTRAGATALTSMLAANERSCYYADVDGVGEKVGEYIVADIQLDFITVNRLLLRCSIRRIVRRRLCGDEPGRQGIAGRDERETGRLHIHS